VLIKDGNHEKNNAYMVMQDALKRMKTDFTTDPIQGSQVKNTRDFLERMLSYLDDQIKYLKKHYFNV
jgi:hypothetical protein